MYINIPLHFINMESLPRIQTSHEKIRCHNSRLIGFVQKVGSQNRLNRTRKA